MELLFIDFQNTKPNKFFLVVLASRNRVQHMINLKKAKFFPRRDFTAVCQKSQGCKPLILRHAMCLHGLTSHIFISKTSIGIFNHGWDIV